MLRDYILKEDMQKKYLEQLAETMMGEQNIWAWGTGRGAKKLLQFIEKIGWGGCLRFIDTNKEKWNMKYEGFLTVSPSTFFEKNYDPDACIFITCADVGGVKQTIQSYADHSKVIISDLTSIDLDSSESWFDFIWSHMEEFSEAYEMLADEKSKKIFAGLLNYRISRDAKFIEEYVDDEKNQYFDRSLFALDNLIFADCGAYVGDTVEQFIRLTQGKYKKIYAFEPDKIIYEKLEANIRKNGWERVSAYNIGTYKEKAYLGFESAEGGTEMSNHISDAGNVMVSVDSLDNIVNGEINLIKMDIEGAEYDSLLGCKRLIRQYKPVLAICIYHKRDDYYKLLKLIRTLDSEYRLYVRQYAFNDNETIVYAV